MRVQVNWLAAPRNQRRGQKFFTCRRFNCALIWFEWVGWRDPHFASCLLAMSAIGTKRTKSRGRADLRHQAPAQIEIAVRSPTVPSPVKMAKCCPQLLRAMNICHAHDL